MMPGTVRELRPAPTHPLWSQSAILTGGPWGRLWLPSEAEVTTDRDLLQWGLVTGGPPWQIRERRLLVVELGYVPTKNLMACGMLTEIILIRRDMVNAPTWLLVSDDPALDPSHVLTGRNRKLASRWRSIRLTDSSPGGGDLETTIRVPGKRVEPDVVDVDELIEDQLDDAFA